MGLTFNLGRVSPSVFTDSSLNVGIGAAPSGSYKLEVTGTAKVSSTLLVSGAATFSSTLLTGGDITVSKSGDSGLNLNSTTTNGVAVTRYQTTAAGSLWGTGINITGADSRWEVYNFALGSSPFFIRSNGKVNISTSVAADVLLNVVNGSSTGSGLNISAGSSSSNYALRVESYNGASSLLYVRGDGNVGIGTSAPATQLEIYNSSTLSGFRFGTATATESQMTLLADLGSGYDNGGYIKTAKESTSNSYLSFGNKTSGSLGEKMRITSGGNVAINAGGNLQLYRPDSSSPSSSWFWNIYMSSSNLLSFAINAGTPKMVINASGNVGVGITTGTINGRFCVEGDGATTSNVHLEMSTDANRSYLQSANRTFIANAPLTIGCSSIIIEALAGAGSRTVTASADGTLSASSDSTLKQEDKEYKIQGLAEILQLKPRAYKWLSDIEIRAEEATTEIGFFADEVNPIIPSAAPKGNDDLYGFYDRAVIAALVKAIQEQQAIITSLQDRLDKAGL